MCACPHPPCTHCNTDPFIVPDEVAGSWGKPLANGWRLWEGPRLATGPWGLYTCECKVRQAEDRVRALGLVPVLAGPAWAQRTAAEAWIVPTGPDVLQASVYVHPALWAIHQARDDTRPGAPRFTQAEDRATLARWLTPQADDPWRTALAGLTAESLEAALDYLRSTVWETLAWFDARTVQGEPWVCLWGPARPLAHVEAVRRGAEQRIGERAAGLYRQPLRLADDDLLDP